MNSFQTDLYLALMNLVNSNEAFYFQDFRSVDRVSMIDRDYRIFNYRLASYTDFQAPGAMECRGIMFEVEGDEPIRLVALPMEKFFNLNENPMTIGLDLTEIDEILLKADGSLMSSYTEVPNLKLKSKGSISSEQCLAAMEWLKDQSDFEKNLWEVTNNYGYTVNLEWCSPIHRIVIGYMKPHLKVLNARHRLTGKYMSRDLLIAHFGDHVIDSFPTEDPVAFVASIPELLDDIEGYVIQLKSGQRVKIKTNKYLSLHHAKDSVNNPRRLFECIIDEGVDDLRGMFYTDQVAMMMIDQMQTKVDHLFNTMVKEVETFYEMNKSLDRKEFALKGQAEVTPMYFSLVMNLYLGKDPQYKAFLKKRYKELGFKDEKIVEDEE